MVAAIGVTAPAVMGETLAGGSVAFDADFKARRMGTSELRLRKTGPQPTRVFFGPLFGFPPAVGRWSAIEPPGIAPLAGLAEIALADATAVPVKALVAATCAERAMLALDRCRELQPATRVAAAMAYLDGGIHDDAPAASSFARSLAFSAFSSSISLSSRAFLTLAACNCSGSSRPCSHVASSSVVRACPAIWSMPLAIASAASGGSAGFAPRRLAFFAGCLRPLVSIDVVTVST